ncbi:MAG: hypothetical protein U5L10_05135 [Candidatus Moranbacteria bacterium]|nr:hypothetical protein [Candidatus Moranbacteria bacterium]
MKINDFSAFIRLNKILRFLRKKGWLFTILFFLIILGFSVQTWRDCILNPEPSQEVINEVSQSKRSYEEKIKRIERVNDKIEALNSRFQNPPEIDDSRSYFKPEKINKEGVSSQGGDVLSEDRSAGIKPLQ